MLEQQNTYVYIVISQTTSRFGGMIRKVLGCYYNHASIAFDEKLENLYSFGRFKQRMPLIAGLIKEYPARFLVGNRQQVPVCIYKIPITEEQYQKGLKRIQEITEDEDEYLYNLFSVLSYPLSGGFSTYKAYSCVEFVAHMVHYMNIPLTVKKPAYAYTPEELGKALNQKIYYEGNLLEYCHENIGDAAQFFAQPDLLPETAKSAKIFGRLLVRAAKQHLDAEGYYRLRLRHALLVLTFGLRSYEIKPGI